MGTVTDDPYHLRAEMDAAIQHNVGLDREVLSANLGEYLENFAAYVTGQRRR